jgi:radical SAM superfamily enzyme YgiQ (UPF0313 family)
VELPCRAKGDVFLRPGELTDIRRRLRRVAARHDLATVAVCPFDRRTRMLPFDFAEQRMAPAGIRAVGSALVESGFPKTRLVLQRWTPNVRPSGMRLDGRAPDLLLISSLAIYTGVSQDLIRDACRMPPSERPLVLVGGPTAIYEPWDVFSADPSDPWGADAAVTGEEYVLLALLEVLLDFRGGRPGPAALRDAFDRAREAGALDRIPGLVYARTDKRGVPEELVDTGIQRLVEDLDELPHPVHGYRLLEPPGGRRRLASAPLAAGEVRRWNRLGTLVLTLGCKFRCPYCPIPAYNQRAYRTKSGERIADEMFEIARHFGVRHFFGADDNFFNDRRRTLAIIEALNRAERDGVRLSKRMRWATEVTVHDTLRMRDHLRAVRRAGVRALWIGVEDMTARLVRKGQTVPKTLEAFRLLRERGIVPMPMMMHYDDQPLLSRGTAHGLLNQVRLLRKAGACSIQVHMIGPSPGSRFQEAVLASGQMITSAGGRRIEPHMVDGNFVVVSRHARPWRQQLNLLAAYLYFYNPLRLLWAIVRPKSNLYLVDPGFQAIGMWGLLKNVRRTVPWAVRLALGEVRRRGPPPVALPMRGPDGGPPSHLPPGTRINAERGMKATPRPSPQRAQRTQRTSEWG